jgi:mono/diheme cytochrome c family protein
MIRALALALVTLAACDESQVWHAPDFQLGRMQEQPRVGAFDPRGDAPPPFTVARGHGPSRPRPRVTRGLVLAGRSAFDRTCAACHGVRGDGESLVARKMLLRRPPSLLEARIQSLSDEELHAVVERGYGLMPPYAGFLSEDERWAVVGYVRALAVAQRSNVSRLPADVRAALAKEAP